MNYKVLVYDRELKIWHIVKETNDKSEAYKEAATQENDKQLVLIDYD